MSRLCKRERELKAWLEKGSSDWPGAFYECTGRRNNPKRDMKVIKSWFNRTLAGLKSKGHFGEVGFVFETDLQTGLRWVNPLIQGQGTKALVGVDESPELLTLNKII